MNRLSVPCGRCCSVYFWVFAIVMPIRVFSALNATSVVGPRFWLRTPPHSHDGMASSW